MDLSIVIVNYNVQHFLEQCLISVYKAQRNLDIEVFVVDNDSVDDSLEMLEEKFPQVHVIANKKNVGFSVANNQALRIAKGRYSLLLNPDTVVQEDTFTSCVEFMDANPEAGGLGVKMIDGKGIFLPESKRGLPTPEVAFYKIFGLSSFFPNSKRFGKYHLSYLGEDETNEVEILAGAFMLMRQETLDKVGLLDEQFFMYGEDIDLSYRIILGGYKNYYFPETKIIHYKGESTKKGSLNYVLVFYRAMILFAQKHFENQQSKLFSLLIKMAVYFRMAVSLLRRLYAAIKWPTIDLATGIGAYFGLITLYETYFHKSIPLELTEYYIPIHTLLLLTTGLFLGVYHPRNPIKHIKQNWIYGTLFTLVVYSFLPETWRFSRLIIALFPTLFVGLQVLLRKLSDVVFKSQYFNSNQKKNIGIIGDKEETQRVLETLKSYRTNIGSSVEITLEKSSQQGAIHWDKNPSHLQDLVRIHSLDELVFCPKNMSIQNILDLMVLPYAKNLEFKMAPDNSPFVIGSNSINTQGEIYLKTTNPLHKKVNLM